MYMRLSLAVLLFIDLCNQMVTIEILAQVSTNLTI